MLGFGRHQNIVWNDTPADPKRCNWAYSIPPPFLMFEKTGMVEVDREAGINLSAGGFPTKYEKRTWWTGEKESMVKSNLLTVTVPGAGGLMGILL